MTAWRRYIKEEITGIVIPRLSNVIRRLSKDDRKAASRGLRSWFESLTMTTVAALHKGRDNRYRHPEALECHPEALEG
jgi:hypothetical protein